MKVPVKVSLKNEDGAVTKTVSVDCEIGDNLAHAVELFGEETVFNLFKVAGVKDYGDEVRRLAKKGQQGAILHQSMGKFKLGTSPALEARTARVAEKTATKEAARRARVAERAAAILAGLAKTNPDVLEQVKSGLVASGTVSV